MQEPTIYRAPVASVDSTDTPGDDAMGITAVRSMTVVDPAADKPNDDFRDFIIPEGQPSCPTTHFSPLCPSVTWGAAGKLLGLHRHVPCPAWLSYLDMFRHHLGLSMPGLLHCARIATDRDPLPGQYRPETGCLLNHHPDHQQSRGDGPLLDTVRHYCPDRERRRHASLLGFGWSNDFCVSLLLLPFYRISPANLGSANIAF